MGLVDIVSGMLGDNKKSNKLVSKSKKKPSMIKKTPSLNKMVSREYTVSKEYMDDEDDDNEKWQPPMVRDYNPAESRLPRNWGKSKFYLVSIRLISSDPRKSHVYPGYIRVTDKWVEYHCFDSMRNEQSAVKEKDRYESQSFTEDFGSFQRVHHPPAKLVKGQHVVTTFPSFGKIKMSAVIARDKVRYEEDANIDSEGNGDFFLSTEVQVRFNKEDIDRWHKFNPKNEFRRKFPEFGRRLGGRNPQS